MIDGQIALTFRIGKIVETLIADELYFHLGAVGKRLRAP